MATIHPEMEGVGNDPRTAAGQRRLVPVVFYFSAQATATR